MLDPATQVQAKLFVHPIDPFVVPSMAGTPCAHKAFAEAPPRATRHAISQECLDRRIVNRWPPTFSVVPTAARQAHHTTGHAGRNGLGLDQARDDITSLIEAQYFFDSTSSIAWARRLRSAY
ncbi:hypothetical protein, partial [Frateuria aurantia]